MKNILQSIGFTKNQENIYSFLVKEGAQKASIIAKSLGMQRALAYRTLEELMELGFITRDDSTKIIAFAAVHPSKLRTLGKQAIDEAKNKLALLDKHIGTLTSDYNLVHGKPGVEFFEGKSGFASILSDTLTSGEVVYTYVDIDTLTNSDELAAINADYAKKRKKLGITKKYLVRDTPLARKRYKDTKIPNTEIRLLPKQDLQAFNTTMHIYDDKVSYITFANKHLTATLITNPSIYALHRQLFDDAWERATIID